MSARARAAVAMCLAVALVVALAACTNVVAGRQLAISDPFEVGGKPVGEGPSGLRPGAPGPMRTVMNGDGGPIDVLVVQGIDDIEEFWRGAYGSPLEGRFIPVKSLYSYDSRFKHGSFCGMSTAELGPNAVWCPGGGENCPTVGSQCVSSENSIGWDRGVYMAGEYKSFGALAPVGVVAHEYGHAITFVMAKLLDNEDQSVESALVSEQQADCFEGAYLRWVVDGKSRRFTLNNGDGLSQLLASTVGARDPLLYEKDPSVLGGDIVHGSAFERVSAIQIGFDDGARGCAGIDVASMKERREGLPEDLLKKGETGESPITQDNVKTFVAALNEMTSLDSPPDVEFDASACGDASPSVPASYCPETNTIAVDLDRLVLMGTSLARGGPLGVQASSLFGDYTAYSVVASRYALAMQKDRGDVALEGTDAGLRTACLAGTLTRELVKGVDLGEGRTAKLDAGDLDEAVVGVLTNGAVAGDVDGAHPPSAFARVDAFREGVLGSEDDCYTTWPN